MFFKKKEKTILTAQEKNFNILARQCQNARLKMREIYGNIQAMNRVIGCYPDGSIDKKTAESKLRDLRYNMLSTCGNFDTFRAEMSILALENELRTDELLNWGHIPKPSQDVLLDIATLK